MSKGKINYEVGKIYCNWLLLSELEPRKVIWKNGMQKRRRALCECQICGKNEIIEIQRFYYFEKYKRNYCSNCTLSNFKNKHIGTKCNKLTIIEYLGVPPNKKEAFFKAQCDCGIIIELPLWRIRRNISCGCLGSQKAIGSQKTKSWTGYEEIHGTIWGDIKNKAFSRNLEWNITIQDAWNLFLKQDRRCALSGLPLHFGKRSKDERIASLDRIDSKSGYIISNIQWVHKDVNMMKLYFTQERFIEICNLVSLRNFS